MTKRALVFFIIFAGLKFLSVAPASGLEKKMSKISLPEILPLKLRYKVGETLHYRLVRDNINFKPDGTRFGEMKVVTYFIRTRLKDDSAGGVQERFTWKSFRSGQTWTDQPLKMTEFKPAENFSLVYSVNEDMAISKFDFSSLPRTMDGFMFMILTWDAVTFDGSVRPTQTLLIPDEARIGTEFREKREPHDFVFEFPPLVTNSKYTFSGKSWVRIAGVTIVRNIPCAVIEFGQSENRIEMNLHLKPMEIKNHGFEHFWGKTYLSLEDGRTVRGELVGPVVMIQDMQKTAAEAPERMELFAIGYLEMDLLSDEEFEAELDKGREEASIRK